MRTMDYQIVENLRAAAGTLPSEHPKKSTEQRLLLDSIELSIEDCSRNPYKAMFCAATSTWGDNKFERKWPKTSIEGKLEVIKAVLTHNTLPQAKEMVNFLFRVNGVPRWLFDYHTQVPFITIMSIGCRDNNKLDSDIILTTEQHESSIFLDLKDIYGQLLTDNKASWQGARAFLPQSYQHAYHFSQNLLAIVGVKGFHASGKFGTTEEEKALELLYDEMRHEIYKLFPLIGYYLEIMFQDGSKDVFDQIRKMKPTDLSVEDLKLFNQD